MAIMMFISVWLSWSVWPGFVLRCGAFPDIFAFVLLNVYFKTSVWCVWTLTGFEHSMAEVILKPLCAHQGTMVISLCCQLDKKAFIGFETVAPSSQYE